jgi:hypothetical protein
MEWIFDHFQLVVFAVVIVIWVLRAIVGGNKASEESGPTPRAPAHTQDPAEAERTRQIQEEIRRRILARQRGETISPPTPPPVVVYEEPEREEPEEREEEYLEEGPRTPMPSAAARRQADTAQAAILEQQRLLAEQLHALRAARAAGATAKPVSAFILPREASAEIAAHQRSCRRELLRDLRQPTSVRRAILLKEILGQPVALQRGWQLPRR